MQCSNGKFKCTVDVLKNGVNIAHKTKRVGSYNTCENIVKKGVNKSARRFNCTNGGYNMGGSTSSGGSSC
jgi:hypothetical protein